MAQVVRTPDGAEVVLQFDETLVKVKQALPARHPLVETLTVLFEEAGQALQDFVDDRDPTPGAQDIAAEFLLLIELVGDWKRGVRDWSEVEQQIRDAEDYIEDLDVRVP